MKVKIEAICDVEEKTEGSLEDYMQRSLDLLLWDNPSRIKGFELISATEEKVEPKKEETITGEPCPICGYNGEMKIIGLTDEYVEVNCPQCHNRVKIPIVENA